MSIKTRFAPSPTGYLHLGGARTALFCWLYAKKNKGTFVLRIEDTDLARSTAASVDAIIQGMQWLGLDYDAGPYYQTQRFERYAEIIQQLLEQGDAYYCYCSKEALEALRKQQIANKEKPRYNGKCRNNTVHQKTMNRVIRFRNPEAGEVIFNDLLKGKMIVANQQLDDLIIARTDGSPTYNLTVVVDDMDMQITDVIRGDDHINNTPRQINILKALNADLPRYAHLPMILGDDGVRLSKRHGAVSVMQYRDNGFLPEALLSYLVKLGWSHGDQEIFTLEQMVELFDLSKVKVSASAFNPKKLIWLNHQYIMNSDPELIARHLAWHMQQRDIDVTTGPALVDIVKAQRQRSKTLVEMADASVYFYEDFSQYDEKAAKKNFKQGTDEVLQVLLNALIAAPKWHSDALHNIVLQTAEKLQLNLAKVAQPLRVAICGTGMSPSIDITLCLLGKDKTLRRLQQAIDYIKASL